ncbi:flippase [Salinisphaera aquimarina]|uniref:Flippase n=1 Tax=Salinisphaera aquimarina TaxID=2094031 RepID=A0ABV7ESE5_9GAMM
MSGDALRAQLVRGGVGSVAIKVANLFLMLGTTVVIARVLGPSGYGVYAYVLAIASLLAIPVQFGFPTLVVRETAKFQARQDWSRLRGVWIWSSVTVAISSLVITALLFATKGLWGLLFSPQESGTFAWALILVPILALGMLRGAALRGLRHTVQGQLPEFVAVPGLLLSFIVAIMLLWTHKISPQMVMILHVSAATCAFMLGIWLLARYTPLSVRVKPKAVFEHRLWMAAILPLALLSGLQVINKNTDLVMLGLLSSSDDVGVYKASAQAGTLASFGLGAANLVVAPYFSRLYNAGDLKSLQYVITLSARVTLAFAVPVVLAFFVLGPWLLKLLFGPAFVQGYPVLIVLSAGQLINAAFGSVGLLLNMTGHERDTLKGFAAGATTNVILNVIFIPKFGPIGAASATAIGMVVWNIVLWRLVHQRLGFESSAFRKLTQA